MAVVYLAHDVRHNRKVAIKVLRPEVAAIIGAERFLKEIETTANLQHPNILPLFDSRRVEGTVFYVMPYVAGESLRARLRREVQLPIADEVCTYSRFRTRASNDGRSRRRAASDAQAAARAGPARGERRRELVRRASGEGSAITR